MTRIPHTTVRDQTPADELAGGYTFRGIPDGVIEVGDMTAGMINRLPRDKVPPGSGRVVRNGRIRDYWVGRRPGTAAFGGTAPDSNQIIGIVTFVAESGEIYFCRITSSAFHVLEPDQSGWISYSILDKDGNSTSFIGVNRHVSVAQFFDRMYIADGINPIWEVDFSAGSVKEIDGAPKANFIATFAERIIAANVGLKVGGVRPATVVWPVNANPRDWTGFGSGFEDLASTNIGDPISGAFSFGGQLILLKNRSIWHASRQPFASAPFSFVEVIGGMGCDMPHTAAKTPIGIIYADQRTREVYLYTPGSLPRPLGAAVNRDLLTDLEKLDYAQGAFDPYENEYHLGIVPSGQTLITKVWVLNLEKLAWNYDDAPTCSAIGVVLIPGASVTIDSLSGSIDSQNPSPGGTIDDYGEDPGFTPTLFKGTSGGVVLKQSFDADDDSGTGYNFEFSSPNLGSLSRERTCKEVNVAIEPGEGGAYSIAHSKDETNWANTKSGTLTTTDKNIRNVKQFSANDIYWRIISASPGVRLLNWWAKLLDKHLKT